MKNTDDQLVSSVLYELKQSWNRSFEKVLVQVSKGRLFSFATNGILSDLPRYVSCVTVYRNDKLLFTGVGDETTFQKVKNLLILLYSKLEGNLQFL